MGDHVDTPESPPSRGPDGSAAWSFGCLGCAALAVVSAACLILALPGKHQPTRMGTCRSNLRQLSMGLMMYAQDHDDRLPPAAGWETLTYPYYKNSGIRICPSQPRLANGYGFNLLLDGKRLNGIPSPEKATMLFESRSGAVDATDALLSWTTPHLGEGNAAFADGHVRARANPGRPDAGLHAVRKPARHGAGQ